MSVYTPCVCLVPTEAREGCWFPLEVALLEVMNHHVSAENHTQVVWKTSQCYSQCLQLLSPLSIPFYIKEENKSPLSIPFYVKEGNKSHRQGRGPCWGTESH